MSKPTSTPAPAQSVTLTNESPEVIALRKQIADQQAQLEAMKAALEKPVRLTLKVSEKGAVSLYGMGKFPITLYGEQWDTLLDYSTDIRKFVTEQRAAGKLSSKADKVAREKAAKEAEEAEARKARIAAAGMTGATR